MPNLIRVVTIYVMKIFLQYNVLDEFITLTISYFKDPFFTPLIGAYHAILRFLYFRDVDLVC